MYTNYNIPQNKCNYQRNYRNSGNSFDYGMNYNYPTTYYNNGDRFIGGGFLGPFILGGITGGLLAPAFYPRPYPIYPYPPAPYPIYGPF